MRSPPMPKASAGSSTILPNGWKSGSGGGLDALTLWRALAYALHAQDWNLLRPVARVNRKGRRVFVCRLADGRFLFVLFDCQIGLPITVFREGMVIRREGKGTMQLGVPHDLR